MLGPRIFDLRNARGWKQVELARRASLRPARLSRIEKSREVPRLDELLRIAQAFHVTLDELALGRARGEGPIAQLVRDIEASGSPEELSGIAKILQILLLGFRAELRHAPTPEIIEVKMLSARGGRE